MGCQWYDGGDGWGDNPPYDAPVFVLTHHPREPQPESSVDDSPPQQAMVARG